MRIYAVTEHFRGKRLDRFLQAKVPKLSRRKIQRAIRTRVETSWHPRPRPSLRVSPGGCVVVRFVDIVEPEPTLFPSVLYRDDDLLVIDKPAGLLVHPTHTCRRNNVVHLLRQRFPGSRIALAHRLDRETSGLMVVCRTVDASRHLAGQFDSATVRKVYLAVVHGRVSAERGVIDRPLGVSRHLDVLFRQSARGRRPRRARTAFRVVRRFADTTLLRVAPATGRRHQIRAHLAEAGHPIVGDKLYATDDRFYLRMIRHGLDDAMRRRLRAPRQLLHAFELTFLHPGTGRRVRYVSPPPEDFLSAVERLAGAPAGPGARADGPTTISDCPTSSER